MPTEIKIGLIEKLADAGLPVVESGALSAGSDTVIAFPLGLAPDNDDEQDPDD